MFPALFVEPIDVLFEEHLHVAVFWHGEAAAACRMSSGLAESAGRFHATPRRPRRPAERRGDIRTTMTGARQEGYDIDSWRGLDFFWKSKHGQTCSAAGDRGKHNKVACRLFYV